jgi:hypothetical protein
VQGWLTGGCGGVPTVVVDGGLGKVFVSVLHGEICVRSTPGLKNEEGLPRSDDSPNRAGGHRCSNGVATLRCRGGASEGSESISVVGWCSTTFSREWKGCE